MTNTDAVPHDPPHAPLLSPAVAALDPRDRELLVEFRRNIHGLGVFWMLGGTVGVVLGLVILFSPERSVPFSAFLVIACAAQFALGLSTYRKSMSAVVVGLVLAYPALVLGLFTGSASSFWFSLGIVITSHRLRGWARDLEAKGIPLTRVP